MRLTPIYPLLTLLTFAYALPAPGTDVHAAPVTRAPECNSVATCKVKGQKVWDLLTAATTDTAGISAKYEESYKSLEVASTVGTVFNAGKRVKTIMKALGVTLPSSLKGIEIKGKTAGQSAYENYFSSNAIFAINNFKAQDPVETAKQVNWNVVAFEQFKNAGGKPTDLKYVMRFEISNAGTKAVLEEVYKSAGKEADITAEDTQEWQSWTHSGNGDSFLGLLGTPNGNGAGYILSDYAATLGQKSIQAIHTGRQEGQWSMVVEYTPSCT
jgi:hypothetical protein